jgi:hypothetical protein
MRSEDPLQYPPHYPPTDRWQRFFIGVRWLGPDLSFFKQLSAQQKARTSELLVQWGGGTRQQVANKISAILARRFRWSSIYFLPGDNVGVIAGGPRFDSIDGGLDVEEAIDEIEEGLGITMPKAFWQGAGSSTLGEIVDQLLAAGAAPTHSPKPNALHGTA